MQSMCWINVWLRIWYSNIWIPKYYKLVCIHWWDRLSLHLFTLWLAISMCPKQKCCEWNHLNHNICRFKWIFNVSIARPIENISISSFTVEYFNMDRIHIVSCISVIFSLQNLIKFCGNICLHCLMHNNSAMNKLHFGYCLNICTLCCNFSIWSGSFNSSS